VRQHLVRGGYWLRRFGAPNGLLHVVIVNPHALAEQGRMAQRDAAGRTARSTREGRWARPLEPAGVESRRRSIGSSGPE
jgi:hypothetical protein